MLCVGGLDSSCIEATERPVGPNGDDMAEQYFPYDTERLGTAAGLITLFTMSVLLYITVVWILSSRDIHRRKIWNPGRK